MSVPKSILAVFGADAKKIFNFLVSNKVQTVISAVETVAEDVYPPITGIIDIANLGFKIILETESFAASAGLQNGTGQDKAAIVLEYLTPLILAYAQSNGLPVPTIDKIKLASDALVDFLNIFDAKT